MSHHRWHRGRRGRSCHRVTTNCLQSARARRGRLERPSPKHRCALLSLVPSASSGQVRVLSADQRSGRAMARTGRRMMPTFPSPSLKFRTSSFPRYGLKASQSGRACPANVTVKPAPGMPAPSTSLHRPFARVRHGKRTRLCVQVDPRLHVPLCERPVPLYPRVLGSGPSCVVSAHHRVLRPHPPVSPAH